MWVTELFGPSATEGAAKSFTMSVTWKPTALYGPPETLATANDAFPLTNATDENARLVDVDGLRGRTEKARNETVMTTATAANTATRNAGLCSRAWRASREHPEAETE